jgi:hypothetical protein
MDRWIDGLPASWRTLALSEVGTSHLQRGIGCEDASIAVTVGDVLFLAAADGAGSAARAARGSGLAVETAVAAVKEELALRGEPTGPDAWRSLLETVLQRVRGRIEREATDIEAETGDEHVLSQLATTFLAVACGAEWLAALQVGDGWIVTEITDGSLQALFQPLKGEYFNESDFITSVDLPAVTQSRVIAACDIMGITLLTDGLQAVAMDLVDGTPHAPFFQPLFRLLRDDELDDRTKHDELADLLYSERVCERTDDDKTLVLAARVIPAAAGEG